MPEEEETEEKERESPEKRMEEMRKKMKKMREAGGERGRGSPMGRSSLMSRMAAMQGGNQNKALMKSMQQMQKDMAEIKNYLSEILETLKSEK